MGKIFNLNNPFFRFMERVADLFVLNLLTILCSLPVITLGAAVTAGCKVMQNFVMDFEQPVIKSYFRAFKENFKQATGLWLILLAVVVLLVTDVFLTYLYLDGLATMLYVLLGVIAVLVLGTACYGFSMIARYENTFKAHLRNSFILAIAHLPKTVLMLLIAVLMPALLLVFLATSFNMLLLVGTFGISLVFYAHTSLLKPVFQMLEQQADREEQEEPQL